MGDLWVGGVDWDTGFQLDTITSFESHPVLKFTTVYNLNMVTDPNGNLDGLGQYIAVYAWGNLNEIEAGAQQTIPSEGFPPTFAQVLPLAPTNFDYYETTSYTPYDENYDGIPDYQIAGDPYPIANPYSPTRNDGYYIFELTDITMTDPLDKIQVVGWKVKENSYLQDVDNTDVRFRPQGNGNPVDVDSGGFSSVLFDITLMNSEIYDEFGNSIMSSGKIPSQRFELPEFRNIGDNKGKYMFVYLIIYHAVERDNRLGFNPHIKRLGVNYVNE